MTWSKPKIVSKCSSAARFFSGFPLTCWQVTYERLLQQFYLLSCPIDSSFRSWWWAPWHFLTLKYLDTTFVKRHFAPSAEFSCWWWKWSKCVERSPGEGISSRPVLVLMFVTRDHLMEQPSSIDFKTHLRYDAFLKRRGQWGDPTLSLELLPVHNVYCIYGDDYDDLNDGRIHPHRPRWVQSWLVMIRWWSKLAKPCQGLGRNSPRLSILSWLSFSIPHWLLQKTD